LNNAQYVYFTRYFFASIHENVSTPPQGSNWIVICSSSVLCPEDARTALDEFESKQSKQVEEINKEEIAEQSKRTAICAVTLVCSGSKMHQMHQRKRA
jgi:hypothetical protein